MGDELKTEVESKLNPETILKFYEDKLGQYKKHDDKSFMFRCPFHNETNSSLSVDPNSLGKYHCFGCDTSGNLYTFLKEIYQESKPLIYLAKYFGIKLETKAPKQIVDSEQIQAAKANLATKSHLKKQLYDFGISDNIIEKYNIGHLHGRYWVPVKDNMGDFVNVRKYDPGSTESKMISYAPGFGKARLFPYENMNSDSIYLFEGEKDCLVALSLGYNAVTVTGGATTWSKDWNSLFKNKAVVITYDVDDAGLSGSYSIAKKLYPFASQIKIIKLPITEIKNGDFCDYISKLNHTKQDFDDLIATTDIYSEGEIEDEKEYKCLLAEASKAEFIQKRCLIQNVIVCGRDGSPYSIPKKIKFSCNSQSNSKKCSLCDIGGGDITVTLDKKDYSLIEMVGTANKFIPSILRKNINIKCDKMDYEVEEYYVADKIRLSPNTSYNIAEDFKHVIRQGVYISEKEDSKFKEIETNKTYNIKAKTVPEPRSQSTIHQIYDIEPSDTNIDEFAVTDEIHEQLKIFQVGDLSIANKIQEKYEDFSIMSGIYGRPLLCFTYDMVYHSALTFDFQGKSIGKGWLECLAMGDSGTGKTTLAKWLQRHYKLGEFIDGESATEAGLKGGLSQNNGQWNLQWGRYPLNDRRLIVIDEASGLNLDSIANLSNIRSSGECVMQKVVSDKTRARTRAIYMSNPRRQNTGITNYSHGVETIKDFWGKPEDVRRCDIATIVASGEVSIDIINQKHRTIVSKYSSEACHNLVLFAWSRKPENIIISQEAEDLILEKSKEFGRKYSPVIPLFEASDARNKIARFAVSLAIMLYSVNDDHSVIIDKTHVEYVCNKIDEIYSQPRFKYDKFSQKENKKLHIKNPDEVNSILRVVKGAELLLTDEEVKENIQDLLDYSLVDRQTLADVMNVSALSDDMNKNLKQLKRCNAITIMERKIKLNPCLLDHLRKLEALVPGKELY